MNVKLEGVELEQHAEESGVQQIRWLREEARKAAAAPLDLRRQERGRAGARRRGGGARRGVRPSGHGGPRSGP